jgi:hypothetical protein
MDPNGYGGLTSEQALENLDNTVATVNGTRQAHVILQNSIALIRSELEELAQRRAADAQN